MANKIYPNWKEQLMQGAANTSLGGTVKAVLARSASYTYSDSHNFLSDVGSAGTAYHATLSDALASKTFGTVGDAVFDAADFKFTAPATDGNSYNQLLIIVDTGSASSSRLVAFYDTGVTGLPVTPNGGDVNVQLNASGIFTL
jgi:hypothetical protein